MAKAYIDAAGLKMPQNSLTLVIDEQGMYYRIPICVINDPIRYNVDSTQQKLLSKIAPKEKQINVSNSACSHQSTDKN